METRAKCRGRNPNIHIIIFDQGQIADKYRNTAWLLYCTSPPIKETKPRNYFSTARSVPRLQQWIILRAFYAEHYDVRLWSRPLTTRDVTSMTVQFIQSDLCETISWANKSIRYGQNVFFEVTLTFDLWSPNSYRLILGSELTFAADVMGFSPAALDILHSLEWDTHDVIVTLTFDHKKQNHFIVTSMGTFVPNLR